MKIKGFTKLTLQIAILSVSMIALSFITETNFYTDQFCYVHDTVDLEFGCKAHGGFSNYEKSIHYHWNYRGWIYFLTGFVLFTMSCIKIVLSHKESDFKNQ